MRKNIGKMYAYHFLMGCYFVGAVLVPFFTDWGGINFAKIALLQTVYVICVFLFGIPTGVLADRFGRKVCLICSALTMLATVLIYANTKNFGVFFVGEVFWALSIALLSSAGQSLIYDTLKEEGMESESKKILGRFEGCFLLGLLVSAPIGSLIAYFMGLRETMLFMVCPMFVACVVALTVKEPARSPTSETKDYFALMVSGVKYFTAHRAIKILALNRMLIGAPLFMIIFASQQAFKEIGVPLIYFGVVNACTLGVQVACVTKLDFLERLCGSGRRYLFLSAAFPATLLIALFFIHWAWPLMFLSKLVVIFLLVAIVGFGLPRRVLLQNYIHKHIHSENRATVMSGVSMLQAGFEAVCYTGVGYLVEWSLWNTFIVLGSFVLLAAFVSRVREEHLIN